MTLEDLPQFRVIEMRSPIIGMAEVTGTFSHLEGVSEGKSWLYVSGGNSMIGDLKKLNRATMSAEFVAAWPNEHLQVGVKFPWIDAYWGACKVEMILDADHAWERVQFQPEDAAMYRYEGGRILSRTSQLPPDSGEPDAIVLGGWDHEHCEICWKKIGVNGDSFGFRDAKAQWLCEECHAKYALPHDLSFMGLHGKRWT